MKFIFTIVLVVISNIIFANNTDSLYRFAIDKSKNDTDRIKAYNTLGRESTSLDTSLIFNKEALTITKKDNDSEEICKNLYRKAIIYARFNKQERAIEWYNEALKHTKSLKNDILKTNILINLGIAHRSNGDKKLALKALNKALILATKSNNLNQQIRVLNTVGGVEILLANYSKAQVTFLEALEINKQLKDDLYQTVLTNNIGNIYYFTFNYEKAITYYFESLKYAEKIEDKFYIVSAYNNIGLIYKQLEKYDEAILNIRNAANYHLKNDDKYNLSESYNSLGSVYLDQNKLDSALFYFKKSLRIKEETQDSAGVATVFNNIGATYFMKKNNVLAKKYLTMTLEVSTKYNDHYNKAIAYISLGKFYVYLKDKNKALQHYKLALNTTEKHQLNELSKDCYGKLYELYKENGSYKNALYYFEKYKVIEDSLGGETSKLKIEEIETKYEVDKKDTEILLLQKEKELEAIKLKKEQEKSRTNMLLSLLGIGIILLISVIVFIKIRQKQKNKISVLEKRSLKVETSMLRSQMNPHFIFNSLNSIQSFISGNETIDAERYLSKFAKLMRLILDNSRQSFISIGNEIETLELYLELEKLRFNNRFNYSININNIDDEFTLIPPMLAQPYIENAILHGVATITNGTINVDYQQLDEKMVCTIEDNGIGREKSTELKGQTTEKKSSLGIKVTQERIELLAKDYNLNLNIEIIDKKDSYGNSMGTKVIVEMPWNE